MLKFSLTGNLNLIAMIIMKVFLKQRRDLIKFSYALQHAGFLSSSSTFFKWLQKSSGLQMHCLDNINKLNKMY